MTESTFHFIKYLEDNTYLDRWFKTINNLKNNGLIIINKKHKFFIRFHTNGNNFHIKGIKTIEEFRDYINHTLVKIKDLQ